MNAEATKIAQLNDEFRKRTLTPHGGELVYTNGVCELLAETGDALTFFRLVAEYTNFTEDNDPYGEHDFGTLEWHGATVFWKIDYYDQALHAWCDPLSPDCRRVLTVMLASEY